MLSILAMKMNLKLQLKDNFVVLVSWLGMYLGIPWLSFIIQTT